MLIPTSGQRQVVFDDMKVLCQQYFPNEFREIEMKFSGPTKETVDNDEELDLEEELDDEREGPADGVQDEQKGGDLWERGFSTNEDQSGKIAKQAYDTPVDLKTEIMNETWPTGCNAAQANDIEATARDGLKDNIPINQEDAVSGIEEGRKAAAADSMSPMQNAAPKIEGGGAAAPENLSSTENTAPPE